LGNPYFFKCSMKRKYQKLLCKYSYNPPHVETCGKTVVSALDLKMHPNTPSLMLNGPPSFR
jgi:hypothetical protein